MDRQEIYNKTYNALQKICNQYIYYPITQESVTFIEEKVTEALKAVEEEFGVKLETTGISIMNQKIEIGEPNILDPITHLYIPLTTWIKEV